MESSVAAQVLPGLSTKGKTSIMLHFRQRKIRTDPWPKDILKAEVKEATNRLGILPDNLIIFRYKVRELSYHRQEILEELVRIKKDIRPDLVFLPSSNDLHQDHSTVSVEGIRAFKDTAILGYEIPWNNIEFHTEAFISLSEENINRKVFALDAYNRRGEVTRTRNLSEAWRGCECSNRYSLCGGIRGHTMGDKITGDAKLNLKASYIARFLNGEFHGVDIQIKTVEPINDITENALVFSKEKIQKHLLEKLQDVCIVTSALPDEGTGRNAFILVKNPRLAFAKALSEFFVERKTPGIGQYTVIHPTARIGLSVIIGNGCTIGRDVEIGDYTEIRHNVVIADGVKIGKHCLIRSNAVLGEEGFGFEYEEDGTPIRIPHLVAEN